MYIDQSGESICGYWGLENVNNFNNSRILILIICIGNSMICSDISKLLYVISRAVRRVKFETILKYQEWYLCQISLQILVLTIFQNAKGT